MQKSLPPRSYLKKNEDVEPPPEPQNVLYTLRDMDEADKPTEERVFQKLYGNNRKNRIEKHGVEYVDVDEFAKRPILRKEDMQKFHHDLQKKIILNPDEMAFQKKKEKMLKAERLQKEKEENYTISITTNKSDTIKDQFAYPSHVNDLPPFLWEDMFYMLPPLFLTSIRYHQYVTTICRAFKTKSNTPLNDREFAPINDHIQEAMQAGLIEYSQNKVSNEYMIIEYTFLQEGKDKGEDRIVEGEVLDRILPEDEIIPIIEDRLKVNMVMIYDQSQSFTEKKDTRDVKFGLLFFTV